MAEELKKMLLSLFPTPNVPNGEAVRIEWEPTVGKFGIMTRKVSFITVQKGHGEELMKAIQSGEARVEIGSLQARSSNVYNVNVYDKDGNLIGGTQVSRQATEVAETLLEHTA